MPIKGAGYKRRLDINIPCIRLLHLQLSQNYPLFIDHYMILFNYTPKFTKSRFQSMNIFETLINCLKYK